MQLKERRQANKATSAAVVQQMRMRGEHMTEALYSYMENGHCLPTVQALPKLAESLGCRPDDLYERREIDLASQLMPLDMPQRRRKETRTAPKMQFRLNTWAVEHINDEVFKAMGYRTQTEWFYEMLRDLVERYERSRPMRTAGGAYE